MARERVTVGSNPSGTLARIIPIAKRKFSQNVRPMIKPIPKKIRPVVAAMAVTTFVILTTSF